MLALCASCTSGADMTGLPARRVAAWSAAAGLASSDSTIAYDLSKVHEAWARGDLLSLKTECGLLRGDVANGLVNLPTPDSTLTNELGAAYQAFGNASTTCIDASGRGAAHEIEAALTGLDHAESQLQQASARSRQLAGESGPRR